GAPSREKPAASRRRRRGRAARGGGRGGGARACRGSRRPLASESSRAASGTPGREGSSSRSAASCGRRIPSPGRAPRAGGLRTGRAQPIQYPFEQQLVDHAPPLGEDALDGSPLPVAEHDPVAADAEPAVAVEGWLERLQVPLLASQVPQRLPQAALGFGRESPEEHDDLARQDHPHSSGSSAESGTKRVRPARWAAIAFCAAGFARTSIVSTIASRYSRDSRYATVSSRRAMPTSAPLSARRTSRGSWLCARVTEYVE